MIGCSVMIRKLYYLDLVLNTLEELQQALVVDGSEEKKKKAEI